MRGACRLHRAALTLPWTGAVSTTCPPTDRLVYVGELLRVLRPGGRLLLRACLRTAGVRNDMDETVIGCTFAAWQTDHLERTQVPSDTRMLEVMVARLSAPK